VTDAPAPAAAAAPVDDSGAKAVESEAADAKAKADADEIERQKRRAARFGIVRFRPAPAACLRAARAPDGTFRSLTPRRRCGLLCPTALR
jgi:hypothetical protein